MSLGLIPGATGITKTVRLLGLMAAQPYLLEGRLFGPREALELGLVDGLAEDRRVCGARRWPGSRRTRMRPSRGTARTTGCPAAARRIRRSPPVSAVAPAMLAQKTRGLYPAPQAILETMVEGALVDYDTATRIESRKLARIMVGQTAKNMVTAFFFDLNAITAGQVASAGLRRAGSRRRSASSAPA